MNTNNLSALEHSRIAARIRKAERRIAAGKRMQEEKGRIARLNRLREWGQE